MNWVQINIQANDDFRYMKIHIFALRWRDDINRSSQLKEVKQELKGIFKGHKLPLSKRLFNKDDNFRKLTFVDLW